VIAYKGFTPELTSRLGDNDKKNCTFRPGAVMQAKQSKTARTGYHCCENPFECLAYYAWDGQNRFWKVEAEGDIDEDASERIACTKITLIEELNQTHFVLAGMKYMIEHPQRSKWKQNFRNFQVSDEKCEAMEKGHVAIARGERPMVKGAAGAIVGMILEKDGEIRAAKCLPLMNGMEKYAGKWITINEEWEVVTIEEKDD